MKEYIELVAEGKDLTEEQAKAAMEILLSGEASQAQIGAFLMGLRMKGETLDELTGFAGVLRDKADTISPKVSDYVDLVGTVETVLILLMCLPLLHLSLQQPDSR